MDRRTPKILLACLILCSLSDRAPAVAEGAPSDEIGKIHLHFQEYPNDFAYLRRVMKRATRDKLPSVWEAGKPVLDQIGLRFAISAPLRVYIQQQDMQNVEAIRNLARAVKLAGMLAIADSQTFDSIRRLSRLKLGLRSKLFGGSRHKALLKLRATALAVRPTIAQLLEYGHPEYRDPTWNERRHPSTQQGFKTQGCQSLL